MTNSGQDRLAQIGERSLCDISLKQERVRLTVPGFFKRIIYFARMLDLESSKNEGIDHETYRKRENCCRISSIGGK